MSRVAVVMSVYKNDKLEFLKAALESLYAQSYKKRDIFVQCDGEIGEALEGYLDGELEAQRLIYLGKRKENLGLAASLNELLEVVSLKEYEFIMRMDADDISEKDRMTSQIVYMESHPEVDICGGYIEEFDTQSKKRQIIKYPHSHVDILQGMMRRNSMAHVSVLFRARFFQKAGRYDATKKNEDYELWIRALKAGCRFANLGHVLVKVRTSEDFFERRRDLARAYEVMMLKFDATRAFDFGLMGYCYAIAHFALFMAPAWLKRAIYKNLRA